MAHASILDIEQKDYEYLQSLCRCRTIQAQIVDRAKIPIYKAQGESNAAIAERIDVNVNTVLGQLLIIRCTRTEKAYLKAGFKKEGLLRDAILDGDKYADDILMAMLEDDWRRIKGIPIISSL